MDDTKSLGQIAFEAYCNNREWKDHSGKPVPTWTEVRQEIRDAWEVAASAAVAEADRRGDEEHMKRMA